MRVEKLLGIGNGVLGLLVALTPTVLLPVCDDVVKTAAGGTVPMRCHYTAQAEIAVGGLLVLVGALLFAFGQENKMRGVLSALALAIGVIVILIPTVLIPTCRTPTMECNIGSKPGLILEGVVILLIGAIGVWSAWKGRATPIAPAAA